jgi:membrane associated rhomboid family serine protease
MAYSVNGPEPSIGQRGRKAAGTVVSRAIPPLLLLASMWVVFGIQMVFGPKVFYAFGVEAGNLSRPWTWITANFVHVDFDHILGNSVFLLILGLIVGMEGFRRWFVVTVASMFGLGLFATFVSRNVVTGGASGIVFGYFGYLLAVVIAEKTLTHKLIRLVVAVVLLWSYWYTIVAGFIPNGSMSWQGHLGGFLFGALAAFYCEKRERKLIAKAQNQTGPVNTPQPPNPGYPRY